jgi:hypothetical protein
VHGRPRALPFVLVGVFAILLVGAIVLSLSTAPPLDEQQLHVAATATLNASGYVVVDTNSVTSPGSTVPVSGSEAVVVHVLYRAPEAIEEIEMGPNGQTDAVILIGAHRFRESGSQWTELPPSPRVDSQVVRTIRSPLQAAAGAVVVTRQGDLYRFVPPRLDRFLTSVLGVRPSQVSSPRLTAEVRGEFLAHERITALVGRQSLTVDLVFSDIGSAPPVVAPPASSLVPGATPGASGTP